MTRDLVITPTRGVFDLQRVRDWLDARPDAFARYGAGHQHDLPLVSREHAATADRLLDGQGDFGSLLQGHDAGAARSGCHSPAVTVRTVTVRLKPDTTYWAKAGHYVLTVAVRLKPDTTC